MRKCGVEEQVNDRKRLVSTSASLSTKTYVTENTRKKMTPNVHRRLTPPIPNNLTTPDSTTTSREEPLLGWWPATMHTVNPSTPQMTTTTGPSTPLTTITPPKAPNFTPLSTPWVKGPNVYFVDRDECWYATTHTYDHQCHDPKQRIHQEQGELVSTYCMSYDIVNLTHDTTRPHHMNSTSQHIYVFGS